jgi:LssY C-terminus
MNFAAVLALAGYCRYRFLKLSNSEATATFRCLVLLCPIPLGRSRSCGNPAASCQFTSALPIRQGNPSAPNSCSIQLLRLFQASVYSQDAFRPTGGWLTRVHSLLMKKAALMLGVVAGCGIPCLVLDAQFAREDINPHANQSAVRTFAQDSAVPSVLPSKLRTTQEVQLTGDSSWFDTGIDVRAGEHVVATASGTMRYADQQTDTTPAGLTRGFKDLLRNLPFNEAGRGAVIGRIGDQEISQPFLIGTKRDVVSPLSGRLSVAINQLSNDTGDGTYTVRIEIYAADANSVLYPAKAVASIRGVDNNLFSKIPRRVADKADDPGDIVNFLIIGSQDAMEKVFTAAGWVKVDPNVKDTLLHGVLESISKESYLTMPMSPLYLFGRQQDYGWAHAEPIAVVAARNHLRIWKAPFEVNGRTLWIGAATHDIGFERDERNNHVTHKIDPDVDLERDYVEKTLTSTGLVAEVSHVLPANPIEEGKTATGGAFHSNGQILVMKLSESLKNP